MNNNLSLLKPFDLAAAIAGEQVMDYDTNQTAYLVKESCTNPGTYIFEWNDGHVNVLYPYEFNNICMSPTGLARR